MLWQNRQRLTLTQYLLNHLANNPAQKDLVLIMGDLASIGKDISYVINRAGVANILGETGIVNVQDERVKKLDEIANTMCKHALSVTNHFASMASEEEEGVVDMGERGKEAKYIIALDPVDGSSNIDVNVSVGTIFSVHRRRTDIPRLSEYQFFQKGSEQVLAGYILYGSSTVIVFSLGNGVHEFTLDPGRGKFLLSRENIRMPDVCTIYSVNEANTPFMSNKDCLFISRLKQNCTSRYIGSLVADFHRNLLKGGVFLYPGIDKNRKQDFQGKLRLNYEAKPMAFLLEQAGGMAIDGRKNILDILPTSLHQRVPLIMGNSREIEEYLVWDFLVENSC